ncbi:MAG: universal stress protein [Gammaproteobacteria bacterium]|nr:universal stress protein [Gammaproteobacteria bacterium]
MSHYKIILLAVDFSSHSGLVIERARLLAQQNGAQLHLVHVVDYMPMVGTEFGEMVPFAYDVSDELLTSSRKHLARLADSLGIAGSQTHLQVGSVKHEVVQVATTLGVDLIVIGSHGWRGLELLLGATADGILHHAPCDVIVVRAVADSN